MTARFILTLFVLAHFQVSVANRAIATDTTGKHSKILGSVIFYSDSTFFSPDFSSEGINLQFDDWFGSKKEEDAWRIITPLMITYEKVSDQEIIDNLGGEEKAEVKLADIWRLLCRQEYEWGTLQAEGQANIFYVRDREGVLRVVIIHWGYSNWVINAFRLNEHEWKAGGWVFSYK